MRKGQVLLCSLLIVSCSLLPGLEFGLLLDQNVDYSRIGDDTFFNYMGILIPQATWLFGETGELFVSAGLNYQNDPWGFVPELLEARVFWRSRITDFTFGRMAYDDPLGYVASGLFDGGQVSFDTEAGTFSAGAWYTGLLYKRRASIEMTETEFANNNLPLDYNDFFNTYFAPRRLLWALDWGHMGLGERVLTRFSLLGQFDLTDEDLHSQYLVGKMIIPAGAFGFNLGGCFQLIQQGGEMYRAFSAEAGAAWTGSFHGLSLLGRYSSGYGDTLNAFVPFTAQTHGYVLQPGFSGLSIFSLDYTARLHRTFSLGLSTSYFMLTSSGLDDRRLGGEIFGGLYWSPVSDISINLGGGAFLPSLGNVAPDDDVYWRVELNAVISFF